MTTEEVAAGDGGSSSPSTPRSSWTASVSWAVGHGSLRDSISYDSSSLAGCDGDEESSSVLLLKPEEGSDPCEVTVCFRKKHEIHRVYVRSTARVYEIYYASEEPHDCNEYLCTVSCGTAATEVALPEINEGQILERQRHSKMSSHPSENNISDEDGWIEVNTPDCQTADDRKEFISNESDGTAALNVQVCYEATAEITDLSPCVSLTLRLLSIQSKGCVYIDEIYICADPFELDSIDSGPTTGLGSNLAGSSLLGMLVPGLLQLSKNENSRRSDSCGLSNSANEDKAVGNSGKCYPEIVTEDISHPIPNTATEHGETKVNFKASGTQHKSGLEVAVSGETCSPACEDSKEYRHIEKMLDELVSRVGRVENLCLRFEEHIMNPLESMELRLQKMEKQLDSLTARTCCHENSPCSNISSPEFSFHEYDSEKIDCDTADALNQSARSDCSSTTECLAASFIDSKINPSLIVTAPEFQWDDDSLTSSNAYLHSAGKHLSEDKISPCAGYESPNVNEHNGNSNEQFNSTVKDKPEDDAMSNKAPEIFCGNAFAGSNDASCSIEKSSHKSKKPFSIETALTSALEAFMSSAKDTLCDEPKNSNEDEKKEGTVEAPPNCLSEDAESSVIYQFLSQDGMELGEHDNNQICSEATQETLSCDHYHHMERNGNSCSKLPKETLSCDSINNELTVDSDAEEVTTQNEGLVYTEWFEDSDIESCADEGTIVDRYQMNWAEENGTASRNGDFPLRDWLVGRQGQQHIDEETEKTDCSMTSSSSGFASSNYEKSKLEIERALKSAFDDEDFVLSEKFASEKTNCASFLDAILGERYNLNDGDSGLESRQIHDLSQHTLEPIVTLYKDQFFGDVQELPSMCDPVNMEGAAVKVPSVHDGYNSALLDDLLVDVGDLSSTSSSLNVEDGTQQTHSVWDCEQPFTSLI